MSLNDVLSRPRLIAILCINLALALLYAWSTTETHAVSINVTSRGAVATVDNDSVSMSLPISPGRIGWQAPRYDSYRMQATGEAAQGNATSWMGRVGEALRVGAAQPAFGELGLSTPGRHALHSALPASGVIAPGTVRLGEYVVPPYALHIDLQRPEGGDTILIGIDKHLHGYALQARYDQPDLQWVEWNNGVTGQVLATAGIRHMPLVESIKRTLRMLLLAYWYALFAVLVALGAYPLMLILYNGVKSHGDNLLPDLGGPQFSGRITLAVALGIGVTGLIFTTLTSSLLLDRIPHVQDSVAYLWQAKIFAQGRLHMAALPPGIRQFFTEEYIPFFQGKWFTQYPPGQPLMLLLGVWLSQPWLVDPILASAALTLTVLLGRTIFSPPVAWLAGALGLASPFWLFLGSEYMAHPTGLFFGMLFMLAFAQVERAGGTIWACTAGLSAGMLFLTRELTAVGLLAPFAVYALLYMRGRWRLAVPAAAAALVPVAFLLYYNWQQMGSPVVSTYAAWQHFYKLGFGNDQSPIGAFTPGDGVWNMYHNLSILNAHLFGWPYAVALALAAVPFITLRAQRWDVLLLSSFLCLAIPHMFYWCSCLMYGPRFYYEAIPCLLLLTARGFAVLATLPVNLWSRRLARDQAAATTFPALLLTALVLFNIRFYMPAQLALYKGYNYSSGQELQVVRRARVHHALVFVASNPPGFWATYGNVFFANDPNLRGDIIYAHDLGAADPLLYRYFPGRTHFRLVNDSLSFLN